MRFAALSKRESEVVSFLVDGASNREIAAHLNVSANTVKSHVNSIFNKFGVENRTQAAVKAVLLDCR